MKLTRYQVANFRSVEDSGWIDCNDVTTLVGINESGKSNLLLALWKLNPAREGEIDELHDLPVSKLSTLRDNLGEVKFISAEFMIDKESADEISKEVGANCCEGNTVVVSRYYDGTYKFDYPNGVPEATEKNKADENFDESIYIENLNNEVLKHIPKFVYYSNYGNLSAKIYLPHVVKWLNGQVVTGIDPNKEQVRTLRVLFDFVKLNPQEILDLGQEASSYAPKGVNNQPGIPKKAEIEKAENNKEKRSILLQSASNELTTKFKEWWNQGEYRFRFEADGEYFRIWVSDSIRADEVALELRSTGLQWFLSFYLIFLVESQEQHKNAILLLDEAGLTLHPMAQKDLSKFFDKLSETNQIINTTHSPFLIDTSNIDRCRVVYRDENGNTLSSCNLRQGTDALNEKSIYAVHAAMGLSVSDILLQGCQTVIVEGPSDQYYLNAIKAFLIKEKKIAPKQEIVFIPSGGVKGISGVVSIVSSKAEQLPYVIADSDQMGKDAVKKLHSGLYKDQKVRVIEIKDIVEMDNSEVEDIVPFSLLNRGITRMFVSVEEAAFEDEYDVARPILPQIEEFAKKYSVELGEGWKVELSKAFKQALKNKKHADIPNEYFTKWVKLFEIFEN
ncbi:MAG: OLD family endonuclease [Lachnospiraceae bacterium]|nr:OLD family endonuclease [Lachnospiraceae bacterium]